MARPWHTAADNASMPARRLLGLLVALSSAAAPAHALLVAGPLVAAAGGCTHDVSRTGAINALCQPQAPGLAGPAALAVDGGEVIVAAADDGAVTILRRHGGHGVAQSTPPPRSHNCVAASGTECARIVTGLAGADALAVSPDGRDVYAGSSDDRAVVGLTAKTLAPIAGACVIRTPHAGCAQTSTLASVGGLAFSPDGRYLYAASFGAGPGRDVLSTLSRSVSTGALSVDRRAPCIQSLGSGTAVCPRRTAGLEGLTSAIVSADGRDVYAASPISGAVVGFLRNRFTGAITPLGGPGGCLHDAHTTATDDRGCATATAGLRGVRSLVLSSDGTTLFAVAADPGSIVALARNPADGALAPRPGGCLSAAVVAGCTTVPALRGAQTSALADGGHQLLVAALGANAVVALGVDPATGAVAAPTTPLTDVGTLSGPVTLAAGDDGREIYVASQLDDSVATLLDTGA
jgi:DNA-binding beta-propeller fold protein YncE